MTCYELENLGTVEVLNWSASPFPWEADEWPIAVAVLWVSWRTFDGVEAEWKAVLSRNLLGSDSRKRDSQNLSLRDSIEELWGALRNGKMQARAAFSEVKQNVLISPRHWTVDLLFEDDGYTTLKSDTEAGFLYYVSVTVPRAYIIETWPAISTATDPLCTHISTVLHPAPKRGRRQTPQGREAEERIKRITEEELYSLTGEALASHLGLKRTRVEEYRKREKSRRLSISGI